MAEANKETTGNKRTSIKKVDAALMAQGIYQATFNNGTVVRCDIRDLPLVGEDGKPVVDPDGKPVTWGAGFDALPPMAKRTICYGWKQKLDDSMAGSDTEEEAIEEVKSTHEAIVKGEWTLRVAGEGIEGGLFARAFAEFSGKSLSDAKAQIAGLVTKNLEANQKAYAEKVAAGTLKEAPEVTERMVFNRIRDALLEKHADLKAKYEELKSKKKQKGKEKTQLDIDV